MFPQSDSLSVSLFINQIHGTDSISDITFCCQLMIGWKREGERKNAAHFCLSNQINWIILRMCFFISIIRRRKNNAHVRSYEQKVQQHFPPNESIRCDKNFLFSRELGEISRFSIEKNFGDDGEKIICHWKNFLCDFYSDVWVVKNHKLKWINIYQPRFIHSNHSRLDMILLKEKLLFMALNVNVWNERKNVHTSIHILFLFLLFFCLCDRPYLNVRKITNKQPIYKQI